MLLRGAHTSRNFTTCSPLWFGFVMNKATAKQPRKELFKLFLIRSYDKK